MYVISCNEILQHSLLHSPNKYEKYISNCRHDDSVLNSLSFTFCVLIDDDVSRVQMCSLSSDLILQTYKSQRMDGYSFSIATGCERQLVTSCGDSVHLEIRVDFFQNDFNSSKVAILYEGHRIIINEDLSLIPASTPVDDIVYELDTNVVSVSIPKIELLVVRNLTALTLSFDNASLPVAGLCGDLNGQLLLPNCASSVSAGELDSFIESYRLKPSDQILHGERRECGEYL